MEFSFLGGTIEAEVFKDKPSLYEWLEEELLESYPELADDVRQAVEDCKGSLVIIKDNDLQANIYLKYDINERRK